MGKFVLVSNGDSNNRVELKAKTIVSAYQEALEILGWNVLFLPDKKFFKPIIKNIGEHKK